MIRFACRVCAPVFLAALLTVLLVVGGLAQSTGGRILGRVTDPSGAVVADATVTITNEATGVSNHAQTNKSGDFAFLLVPVGNYTIEYDAEGFKKKVRRSVTLTLNEVLTLNAVLEVGSAQETVEVTSEAPMVDTTSTQLGAVVNNRSVTTLPLNARDTYQFLQLQPGVQSNLGGSGTMIYGSDKAGVVSVNGGRGRANNYTVNGGDGNDQFANLPAIQPNPDSIQEFRVITNTFDAEYGRNSGSVVNVVTKSGTNQFHGSAYEFFRNTVLNAKGYFDTETPQFNQNQFGATLGGPIKKDRAFFFFSYEGRQIRQGTPTEQINVPTPAERLGDFSEGGLAAPFQGQLGTDGFVANSLSQRPGCLGAIQAIGGMAPTAGANYSDVFPNNQIPVPCMDPTAVALMNLYVPQPNKPFGQYQSVPTNSVGATQLTGKIDVKLTNNQQLNGYYYYNDDSTFQPLSFFQAGGANVPGFGANNAERIQQVNVSHTWTLSTSSVNEFRFNFFRQGQGTFQKPEKTFLLQNSCGSFVPASQCFSDPNNPRLGITPNLGANYEGVPFIVVPGSFTIGNNFEGQLPQTGNTFQWTDNFTKVHGNHTMKFGVDIRYMQFDQTLFYNVNGYYTFGNLPTNDPIFYPLASDTSTNSYIPSYLLGLPNTYSQGSAQTMHVRSNAYYLFGQDSWRIRPNITLNYGLRWELNTPLTDILGHVQTFRPGQATTVFPCQLSPQSQASLGYSSPDCNLGNPADSVFPTGLVVPGDKGIPPGLTQSYYKAFAPRIGIAWSPSASSGWLHKITGNPGDMSIRAGWGMFYNPIEQLVLEQFGAEPPFGGSNTIASPTFNLPFQLQDGSTAPNPFNGILSPPPGSSVDWSVFRPILLYGEFPNNMRTQYSAQYNLTIQRQVTRSIVVQVGYVGSQGHRLLATRDLNYGNAQSCLDIISVANANPNGVLTSAGGGQTTCGQFGADSSYYITAGSIPAGMTFHLPNGQLVAGGPNSPALTMVGLRPSSSPQCNAFTGAGCPSDGVPVFSSIFQQNTIANSSYNSFQASVERRFSRGLQFNLAYTWSKSFDDASSFEGMLAPPTVASNRSLSLFDARQRLVISYIWDLPIPAYQGAKGALLNGWSVSGITTFQSGFPIRITSSDDNELQYSASFEYPGEPNQVAPFSTLKPQTHANYWFDPAIYTNDPASINVLTGQPLLGTIGNAKRTVCCGPGINNWDFTVMKNNKIGERVNMQFRTDFFNLFNHTQFYNPDGNITDGVSFGRISQARDPRLIQFALKFSF
jgi:hypothetical protein